MATLLVTGSARGIGHEVVRRAAARGDRVIAVVRKEADRGRFAGIEVETVLMDMAGTASVEAGFAEVDRLLGGVPLDGIVHSAAISKPNAIEVSSIAEFEETMNTNAIGSLRVLRAAIPRLRGHGGRVILVTSLWGRASGALLGAYCASKHAIESIADTARRETAGMNLHIVVVEPGVVRTDMLSSQEGESEKMIGSMNSEQRSLYEALYRRYARLTGDSARKGAGISTAQCAEVIERALRAPRPKTRYRAGTDSRIVCFLAWLLPDRWMDGVMAQSLNRKPLPARS